MTIPDRHADADITADLDSGPASCAPTPHHLGLTINPDLTWEDIGIAEPTPHDLFAEDPGMSWEDFHRAAAGDAQILAEPEPEPAPEPEIG